MAMTVNVAQTRISRELLEAEEALDEALIRGSRLFTSIVTARRDLGLTASTGHQALLRLVKTQQTLLSAGGDLARVHGEMLDIKRTVTGDMASDCPPRKPISHLTDESKAA